MTKNEIHIALLTAALNGSPAMQQAAAEAIVKTHFSLSESEEDIQHPDTEGHATWDCLQRIMETAHPTEDKELSYFLDSDDEIHYTWQNPPTE